VWYKGTVLSFDKETKEYRILYDNEEEEYSFPLLEDLEKEEVITIMLVCVTACTCDSRGDVGDTVLCASLRLVANDNVFIAKLPFTGAVDERRLEWMVRGQQGLKEE